MRVVGYLLLCVLFIACEEDIQECSQDYIVDYKNLESDFQSFYKNQSISKSDFLSSLQDFQSRHSQINSCFSKDDKEVLNSEDVAVYVQKLQKLIKLIPKVVYGEDNRIEVSEISNPEFREYARSTAAMFPQSNIGDNYEVLASTLSERKNLCLDERFSEQKTPASCSGFLVGSDILVTAGHCIKNQGDCDSFKWVFDWNEGVETLNPENIYSCESIIKREKYDDTGSDYAVLKLDRRVSGRTPLKYRKSGKISEGESIFVIGYPSGLPGKFADGAQVRARSKEYWFATNLDTFAGNSGSAVFNELTGQVEGILVRGHTDYYYDNIENCFRVKVCESNACSGEDVVRITKVEGLVKEFSFDEIADGLFYDRNFDLIETEDRVLWSIEEQEFSLKGAKFLRKCYLKGNEDEIFGDCDSSSIKNFIKSII